MGEVDLTECARAMKERAKTVRAGNMDTVEDLLIAQAITLNTMFAELALRAKNNMGTYINTAEKYMKLALKAQNQSRMTLETLAEIKNPRPYIQNNKAQY